MTRTSSVTLSIAAALAVALGTGPGTGLGTAGVAQAADAKSKCVLAGGEANMITQDLAEFMAKAALKNSINGMGAKPSGDVKLKCKQNGALQYCKAEQRACK